MSVQSVSIVIVALALLAATLPLVLELLALSIAALLPAVHDDPAEKDAAPMPIVVLIPAHNEEALVRRCIQSIHQNADSASEVLVIAHNCTDATAAKAEAAGARVLVLNDPNQTGKGAALSFGFAAALAGRAQAILVIDADSVIDPDLLAAVRQRLRRGARALQCRYEVYNSQESKRTRLMALAFYGVNVIRPCGRDRLHLSAGILGNGFALRREVLARVPYQAHSVVEDLEYHLALVRAGVRVEFIDSVAVRGEMPLSSGGAKAQRARWEGGRLRIMRRWAPKLLGEVCSGHLMLIEPFLDLLALPVASVTILLMVAACLPLFWLRLYTLTALAVLTIHIATVAIKGPGFARTMKTLWLVPCYILWKLWVFPEIWRSSRLNAAWVRTRRESTAGGQ